MNEANEVAKSYDSFSEREWQRLARDPYHTIEYTITWHVLNKHLPPTGKVLDAGGGPGRYALELCRRGYQTVLHDLSPGNLDMARKHFEAKPENVQENLLQMEVGDVRDLTQFETGCFDAVLCLGGVLSHISDQDGRQQALTELTRVTKPGGLTCVAVIGYFGLLRYMLNYYSDELLQPNLDSLLQTGNAQGPTGTTWHFFHVEEIRQLVAAQELEILEMAGCESLSTGLREATNNVAKDEAKWAAWTQILLDTCTAPGVAEISEHILCVGRKPAV